MTYKAVYNFYNFFFNSNKDCNYMNIRKNHVQIIMTEFFERIQILSKSLRLN